MAYEKVTDRTELTSADDSDVLHVVDVSDTAIDAAGNSKKITVSNLMLSAPVQSVNGSGGAVTGLATETYVDTAVGNEETARLAGDASLQTQISDNDADITALDTRVTTNEGEIVTLDTRVTTAEGDIGSLQTQVTSNDSDITALDTRVTANEADITTLQAATHVNSLNTLTGAVTLSAGTNVTLSTVGNDIEISASGTGGSAVDSVNTLTGALTIASGNDNMDVSASGTTITLEVKPKEITEIVKNVTAGTLTKGTPVHVTGSTGNTAEVEAADAASNQAEFVLNEDITAGSTGEAIALGFINNVSVPNASIYTEGDEVWLASGGGFTTTKPTGTNLVQKLGVVLKVDTVSNTISGIIFGTGVEEGLPNLAQDKVWVGNASGVPQEVTLNTTNVPEATNLYYTDARVDARIAAASVTDLTDVTSAGSGAIITSAERTKLTGIETGAQVNPATTDNLTEGSTNLYYTDARADARISAASVTDLSDVTSAGSGAIITAAERTKLSGIETGAEVNPTAAETKTAYESNADTNAYTDAEKTKLAGIAAGAEVNVQSDWNATTGDALILNKPTIPAALTDTDDLTEGTTNLYYTDSRVRTVLTNEKIYANYPTSEVTGNTNLTSSYEQTMVIGKSSSGLTFQVGANLSRDCEFLVMQGGTGDITITGATGVTISTTSGFYATTAGPNAIIGIKQLGTSNAYVVTGERKPV